MFSIKRESGKFHVIIINDTLRGLQSPKGGFQEGPQPAQQAFLCSLGAKNEEQESKTAGIMAQVKSNTLKSTLSCSRATRQRNFSKTRDAGAKLLFGLLILVLFCRSRCLSSLQIKYRVCELFELIFVYRKSSINHRGLIYSKHVQGSLIATGGGAFLIRRRWLYQLPIKKEVGVHAAEDQKQFLTSNP